MPTRPLPPAFAAPALIAGLVAACCAHARPPQDEPDNLLNDRFGLQAGAMYSSNSTDIRLDANGGTPGTELNAENDLKLPKSKLVARGEVWFRMRERHRVRIANYFVPFDRRATTTLERTITFKNDTFLVNERVESELAIRVLALTYTYSFVKNDRVEAGASLGFDVLDLSAKATVPARLRTAREDRSGPAPLIGFDATGRIAGRFYAEGRGQFLRANVSGIHGSLTSFEVNALYRLHPNVTLGLGFNSFSIDVDSRKSRDTGRVSLKANGPQLFARVGF